MVTTTCCYLLCALYLAAGSEKTFTMKNNIQHLLNGYFLTYASMKTKYSATGYTLYSVKWREKSHGYW